MTDPVDPRLARRRRQVQEASARRRLKWTITLLLLAVSAGLVVAVFQSSWFSIDKITVEGEMRAPVEDILAEAGIVKGVSIVSVRAGRAEELLRGNPWVAEAQVRVVWPRSVSVIVVEHVPVARVTSEGSWVVASGQGAVLASSEDIVESVVDIDAGPMEPGGVITDRDILGALEFVASLPTQLDSGAVVTRADGELEALVAGHEVVLGGPIDMAQKAATLTALLDKGVPEGATISMTSPLRPAVTNPQSVVESSEEGTTTTAPSG
jgi:hypothetical protein